MKEKLLHLLQQADDFMSGQKLSEQLGISRTAVWKYIRQLEEDGYVIEAVKNRGYRISSSAEVMNAFEITRYLETGWLGRSLEFHDVIGSTNTRAKQQADGGAPEGLLVVADRQKSGRGRLGRAWSSPAGCGLFFTYVLRPEYEPARASMVTLLAAMAMHDAIAQETGVQSMIKWPNDIIYDGRKICGILTEMSTEETRISYIVTGIGVNVNNESFPEDLQDKAVSLSMLTGRKENRSAICAAFCNHFEHYYKDFVETGDLAFMVEDYNKLLAGTDRDVIIASPEGEQICRATGIDADGSLCVVLPDGSSMKVSSGEVSIRGIYGHK